MIRSGRACVFAAALLLSGCGGDDRAAPPPPPPELSPPSPVQARRLGPTPAGVTIRFVLLLRVDQHGIDRYLADVNDPDSPRYRDFLSPAEYGERFGLPRAELAILKRVLARRGLRSGRPNQQRATLPVEGTAAATGALLDTSFVDYQSPGRVRFHVPARAPTIPAAMRDAVVGVSGLSTRPAVKPARLDSPLR